MTTTLRVHFDGKVLVPEEPVDLPVGESMEVQLVPETDADRQRPLARIAEWAAQLDPLPDAPSDLAAQVDHYLYGHPKRP